MRHAAPAPKILIALLVVLIGVEALLQAADAGLIGSRRWRSLAYQYGAFWPGLLDNWSPNFTAQPAAMFVTYAFLHGGLEHLLGNCLSLWWLGRAVSARAGARGFALTYVLASMGGALFFVGLSAGTQPMVGASGALFGLAGLLAGWHWLDVGSVWRVCAIVAVLVVLNVALWWWYNGQLAWEAHMGGFVVGFAMAGWLGRNPPKVNIP